MNTKCQVFTPPKYVAKLLDIAEYNTNLKGKRVLENSCGDGSILVEIVRRYIVDCKNNGFSLQGIEKGLAEDIVGVEIDKKHYLKCIDNLNSILEKEGIARVDWKIYNDDFIRREDLNEYDYIIGNPPYISYNEMTKADQRYLHENFESCKKGKFDYSYAFIEKSVSLLSQNGKMAYLVPSSILKTVFGSKLRKIILPYLSEIQDFSQEKVFDTACVKLAIVKLEGKNQKQSFYYVNSTPKRSFEINKSELGEKWTFNENKKGSRRFGDYYKVSHVVATLLNEAFVLKDYELDKNGNYLCGEDVIEKEMVRETATPKTLRSGKEEKILYPYGYGDYGLIRYSEKEMQERFPGTYKYLQTYKDKLIKRKCDKSAKWYEYGRSQAVANLNCEKYLISTVISSDFAVYQLSKECIPYAGMYIMAKVSKNDDDFENIKRILNTEEFKNYVDGIGIHMNGNSLRITSKDIENYMY